MILSPALWAKSSASGTHYCNTQILYKPGLTSRSHWKYANKIMWMMQLLPAVLGWVTRSQFTAAGSPGSSGPRSQLTLLLEAGLGSLNLRGKGRHVSPRQKTTHGFWLPASNLFWHGRLFSNPIDYAVQAGLFWYGWCHLPNKLKTFLVASFWPTWLGC